MQPRQPVRNVLEGGRFQANSVVASVQSAFLARSAVLAGTVPIALLALTQIRTRQNACYVKRANGAALSEQMTLRRAKTVQSEDIRLPLEFQNSQGVINAVLDDSLQPLEPLMHLHVNLVRKAGTSLMKVTLPATDAHKAMEVMLDLQPA